MNPVNLVLGFSKGERQAAEIKSAVHHSIPFRGFRPLLQRTLCHLGLLDSSKSLDALIEHDDADWAFGSMTRCTISLWDQSSELFRKSGTVIKKFSKNGPHDWMSTCVDEHLRLLPSRLRNVVLLSNDDDYVERCYSTIRAIHPETKRINSVAYKTGQVTWGHVVHVGGPGRNHINNWFSGAPGSQGEKMRAVRDAFART